MLRIIFVILLSLMLIIPTVILYQNNLEITENYKMLTVDFDNLEADLFKSENEKQQLDNELNSLQTTHDLLMRDYEESQNTLTKLEQTLDNINLQKINLESEIQQRKDEISQLIDDGNAKQTEITLLTNDLTRRINDLNTLTTRSLELETQISIQDENIENQKQTIDNLEDERIELIEERNQFMVENVKLAEDNARLELLLNEGALENRDEILRLGIDSRQSVVRIGHTGGWFVGTGFLVSNNGCIVTNLHVSNAATNTGDQMLIHFPDGREYTGDLLKEGSLNRGTGHNIDIALVKISATTIPLPLSNVTPQYEDTAILIGHPGELGAWVIAAGSYNGFSPYSWATNDYLFSLPSVFGGASGSPILNMNGEVIALNWGSIVHAPLNQNNDLVIWKDNLGKFIMENQHSLAETSIDIISFLSDTQCRI